MGWEQQAWRGDIKIVYPTCGGLSNILGLFGGGCQNIFTLLAELLAGHGISFNKILIMWRSFLHVYEIVVSFLAYLLHNILFNNSVSAS